MLKSQQKIVYFGNKISNYSKSKSVIETLEPLFKENYNIQSYSDKKNKLFRMFDFIYRFFTNGLFADKIIIDVYSTTYIYSCLILVFLCKLFNKNFILFLHGGNLPNRFQKSPALIHNLFNEAGKIIAPSYYLKNFFESKGYTVDYIPNIIELEAYPFMDRQVIQPKLLYVRGFGNLYNPDMAVKAVFELKKIYPEVKLSMLGSDTDGNLGAIEELINELNLSGNINILGSKNRDEWVELSKEYDIMISTPNIDNTPISIIEGMALGLLIISTDVGGIPFLLNDKKDALLVPVNDHKAMANAVKLLIDNKILSSQLQKNARLKAESFDWKKIEPHWIELFKA